LLQRGIQANAAARPALMNSPEPPGVWPFGTGNGVLYPMLAWPRTLPSLPTVSLPGVAIICLLT